MRREDDRPGAIEGENDLVRRIAVAVVDELEQRHRDVGETIAQIRNLLSAAVREFNRLETQLAEASSAGSVRPLRPPPPPPPPR